MKLAKSKKGSESKRDQCKGCGNKQEYVDSEGRKRYFCIAFENMYMNTPYHFCPLDIHEKEELWRRYGFVIDVKIR